MTLWRGKGGVTILICQQLKASDWHLLVNIVDISQKWNAFGAWDRNMLYAAHDGVWIWIGANCTRAFDGEDV